MTHDRTAVDRDLVNLKVALESSGQGACMHRVHEEIQWAKLSSLVEGARIASREFWGAKANV
jgi:hypothetical protein